MHHRLHHVDGLKVIASQLIVLHHFAAYGPLSDTLALAAPDLTAWLFEYARMAVQVFLVIGGYFAASALAPHGRLQRQAPWKLVIKRYLRLAPPYLVALVLVGLCSAAVSPWLVADFLPEPPTVWQVLAHVFLLNQVLDVPSLSVGTWYVAIDFQLYAMTALLLWGAHRRGRWLVGVMMVTSLFFFNQFESIDMWAPYFYGAYGMGAAAWWAGHSRHARTWLVVLAVIGLVALLLNFRLRIAVALVTALVLGWGRWQINKPNHKTWLSARFAPWLRVSGRIAYALFLTHFAVWILANALWSNMGSTSALYAAAISICAWFACLGLAFVFERYVERPLALWRPHF